MIDFAFEEFDVEQLISGARVTNPSSRNILEKCGFQWTGVELHRFEALGSSTPVDCFRLDARRLVVAEELEQFDEAGWDSHRRLLRMQGRRVAFPIHFEQPTVVIPGRASWRGPGIHTP